MRVEGRRRSLCFGAHQSLGVRGLESKDLWMAKRAACSNEGGDFLMGVLSRTGECGQPSLSTHTVPAGRSPTLA